MKKEINNKEEQLKDFANKVGVATVTAEGKLARGTNERKEILVYDLEVLPEGYTVEKMLQEYKEKGIVVYSSIKNTNAKPPYTIQL
jgi:glycerol dehydrogenase-like iron-containing ADH family enzyme